MPTDEMMSLFELFAIGVVVTLLIGFYCILTTRNLMRALIGMEVLTKGITLLIIVCGYVSNHMATAGALAITLIVIEVAVVVVAVGIVLSVHRNSDSIDSRALRELKG